MSGRNPDDARHEDCGPAEVEYDLSEPDIDDHTAPCMRCDGMIDLDDHGYKPGPTSGEYLCEDCRDEESGDIERAADLESAFDAVLAELDGERDTIETPAPDLHEPRACPLNQCDGSGSLYSVSGYPGGIEVDGPCACSPDAKDPS